MMPMILHSILSPCLSTKNENTDNSKTSLTDQVENNTDHADLSVIPATKCKQHAKRRTYCLFIVLFIILSVNVTLVVIYCYYYPEIKTNHRPVEGKKDGIFLPCLKDHEDSVTEFSEEPENRKVSYCEQNSTAAITNLLTLMFTEFVGRRNQTDDPPHRDSNRPILKQKFSELYYADKTNSTDGSLQIHLEKHVRKGFNDNQTTMTVLSDGMYVIYLSLQFCFREVEHTTNEVSVEILRDSKQHNTTLYHQNIRPDSGLQTFVPVSCLLPVRLKEHDSLSLHLSGMSNLYEMRIGNVIGVKQI